MLTRATTISVVLALLSAHCASGTDALRLGRCLVVEPEVA
jgi:hypothetical protein